MPGDHQLVEAACTDARQTRSGWLRATCPFCVARVGVQDRRQSLSVLPGVWFYRCWRCHASGRLENAPSGSEHLEQPVRDSSQYDLGPPEGFMPLAEGEAATALCTRIARHYLNSRGVTRKTCAEVGVGVSFTGFAAGRIVVPVQAPGEIEWLGWVGRAWAQTEWRYRYPLGMQRGECLFNAAALRVQTNEPVLVVEGVFDALPHWPRAVACLGKPTETQTQMLKQSRRPVLVALDGDAWSEGEALALRLRFEGCDANALRLPPCTDPGNFDRDELMGLGRLLDRA